MANGGAVTPQMTMLTASEPVRPPPQKAVVKPNVLTHVIEGYIIQEGPEPFPPRLGVLRATCGRLPRPWPRRPLTPRTLGPVSVAVPPEAEASPQGTAEHERVELAKCEMCAKLGTKSKFKKSKRFCSSSCVKRYNLACSERLGIFAFSSEPENEDELPESEERSSGCTVPVRRRVVCSQQPFQRPFSPNYYIHSSVQAMDTSTEQTPARQADVLSFPGAEQPLHKPESSVESPAAAPTEMEVDASPAALPSKSPRIWTVQEVADYIQELPGCTDYAEEFRSQEIDGQALLLLKEDHLMTAMNIKLGPALKICAKINSLREEQ
ncbi:polyhomeotic, putative [Ixodes scapularis]|uniref:Polyhomeotic, putative n=1 Tax=Ixodes scapularis TaxID=6945 RepID=B7PYP0_IXOSC|nr:polyhomeotic, putative [Ixodes scapularis]|eukprot:XP_002403529.1 polyhomeotic, putative [Ixodes scapularis]